MAKRFRLEALPKGQQEKLRVFSNQYFPGQLKEKFLDSIEKTGNISPELFKEGNFNARDQAFVSGEVGNIVKDIITQRNAYKNYVDAQTDPNQLTDSELQDRITAQQGLGSLPDPEAIRNSLVQEIKDIVHKDRIDRIEGSPNLDSIAAQLADAVAMQGEGAQTAIQRIVGFDRINLARKVDSAFVDLKKKALDQAGKDSVANVKVTQDLVTGRQKKAKSNADIMSFFESQPGELTKSREALFDPQRARAKDYVQEVYAPGVRERLAARGLENSGEVADAVTSKYADLFGAISDAEGQQLVDDIDFSSQQSYDKVFTDLVNAQADVSGAIGSARNTLRTKQITDFTRKQSDIESKFSFDLFAQQTKAAYDTYQRQVSDKNNALRSQREADLFGGIGSVAGTVIGATVAGPVGAAAGGAAGKKTGSML